MQADPLALRWPAMTLRVNWKTWGQVLTVAAIAAACEGSSGGPAVKTEPKAGPVDVPGPTPGSGGEAGAPVEPKVEPKVEPVVGTLDDRSVQSEQEGPWTRRRVGGEPGAGDLGGFGMVGRGEGGSGSGYGGIGSAGSIGSIGRGGSIGSPAASPSVSRPAPAEMEDSAADMAMPRKSSKPLTPGGPGLKDPFAGNVKESAPLKAGATDDNADYASYLRFLASWTGREDVRGQFQPLDVAGRAFVQVLDGDGQPVPGARIEIFGAGPGATMWQATTYGDGRAPYYPRLFGAQQKPSPMIVRATAGGQTVEASWDGTKELTLRTAGPRAAGPMTLEVLFLIDTTGSMGDEIDQIKTSLLAVTSKAKARREDLVLRYGAVLYRDLNDDYLTMAHPFTEDLQAFNSALQGVSAGGGGDLPEALNQGLERAVEGMQWQADAAKVVFLICDAPPQMRVKGDVLYGDSALRAVGKGLRIHSVAASGLDPLGTLVLRQLAQLTRGKFIFIEYGGTQATAEKHGIGGPVQGGNNLDDILLAQISAEIDGWGR